MTGTMTTRRPHRERKDVVRNRALLLAAADRLISERGLDVSFHDVAHQAGVGIGTVYRHFADKEALLGALVEQRFEAVLAVLVEAEQIEDPVDALRGTILRICELQFRDRAIREAIVSDAGRHRAIVREQLLPILTRIVERARSSGRIRGDFSVTDLPMIFMLTGTISHHTAAVRPDLWRRYVDTTIDGIVLAPADRTGTEVPPPTEAELDEITSATR